MRGLATNDRRALRGAHGLMAVLLALSLCGCTAWKRFAYEGLDRDSWQKPDAVIAILDVAPGMHVADVGAGGGYFTFRLADAVGPGGRVYAVDVDEDMLAYLAERTAEEERTNVEVVRGRPEDPMLPDGRIDLVFSSNTYHHIEGRTDYFSRLRGDLAPGGRVAILELSDAGWFARTFGHTTPKASIVEEMRAAGYALEGDHDLVDRQHFLVFSVAD